MGLAKGAFIGAVCGVMAMSGCTVQSVQRNPAEGPADCRAYWLEERGAGPVRPVNGAASFTDLVEAIFSGFARRTTSTAEANRRYRACLSGYGIDDADGYEASVRGADQNAPYLQRLAPKRPAHCPPGASVLYGGAGYCVGRR